MTLYVNVSVRNMDDDVDDINGIGDYIYRVLMDMWRR
jgi:hypothetical protein